MIMIKIMIKSKSRSGAVERPSVRGGLDRPPLAPPLQGGERDRRGLSLVRGASSGSLAGDALHPPGPPFARGGKGTGGGV